MTATATFPTAFANEANTNWSPPKDSANYRVGESELLADSATPPTVALRQLAAHLPKAKPEERESLRASIVRAMRSPALGEPMSDRIEAVLEGLLGSKQPARLDDAVDILEHAGTELPLFAMQAMSTNPPDQTDPDYWFVLILALGNASKNEDRPHHLVDWALKSDKRQLMEAAILVLADRTDVESRKRLQRLAGEHKSVFIRELASEALEDCDL